MKNYLLLITALAMAITGPSCNQLYEKEKNGIVISTSAENAFNASTIRLEAITDNIIRVTATVEATFSEDTSLIIIDQQETPDFEIIDQGDGFVGIKTGNLTAKVETETGLVTFYDNDGNILLKEDPVSGKSFKPIELENATYYTVRQVFESPEDEAFYGLGQHQNDQMNYKGEDVDLYQHNIVAVVPFLVSNKNYGILWDNCSRTKFGDPREYQPISGLKLYDDDKKQGGLTASYYKDKKLQKELVTRNENTIEYEFVTSFDHLPENFNTGEGSASWKGFIESDESGIHKLLLHSAGYTKVWIDGKLVVDNWRQDWNPWTKKINLDMEKGIMYPIKIEWIPTGGESYISLKYLTPFDAEEQNKLSLYSEVADEIDYYFVYGDNVDEIISGYRDITGKAPIMPKWAMGLWQSRERYTSQDELLDVVREFRKREIPLDNIVLDWQYWNDTAWGSHEFDPDRFPDPEAMNKELHEELNTRIMISVWPKFYEGLDNYKLFEEKGWLYPENINNGQKDWVCCVSTFYDAFSPGARKLFWDLMDEKIYSKGFDAWWMDATEPDILSNTSIEDRKKLMSPVALGPSAKYYNAYSLMNSKGVYEGQRSADPDKRVFILTRSAFAGQQRFASATWSGDVVSRWYDLKAQISAGINLCMSGIPYWTHDIGGFSLEPRYTDPQGEDLKEWRELNTRWFQFGTFSPLFRVHGQYPFREMFNMAPENHIVYKTMLKYDKLRYRLMPYIYSLAGHTYHDNYTMMRGLMMDFPEDKAIDNIGDQFMFGPSILVNPVYEYKATERNVYLPKTAGWFDFYTGKWYDGGQTIIADAPISKIPLYVKAGSIIPTGPEIQYTDEKPDAPLTIFVFDGDDASFDLYEDENTNYNYEKGRYSIIKLTFDNANKQLTLASREGEFEGMQAERIFRVVLISKDKQTKPDLDTTDYEEITYSGEELSVDF